MSSLLLQSGEILNNQFNSPWHDLELVSKLKELWTKSSFSATDITQMPEFKKVGITKCSLVSAAKRFSFHRDPLVISIMRREVRKKGQKEMRDLYSNPLLRTTGEYIEPECFSPLENGGVSLVDIKHNQCRFPHGNFAEDTFRFCGKKVEFPGSYCREHSALCFKESR